MSHVTREIIAMLLTFSVVALVVLIFGFVRTWRKR